jgi:hypothetical protein
VINVAGMCKLCIAIAIPCMAVRSGRQVSENPDQRSVI